MAGASSDYAEDAHQSFPGKPDTESGVITSNQFINVCSEYEQHLAIAG